MVSLKRVLCLFLVFLVSLTSVLPCGVKAVDISQGADKGDLRLVTFDPVNKDQIVVEKTDENGISVKKVVTKKEIGTYNVEFFVKGTTTEVNTQVKLPVYVVFVIDRSYSMKNDSRWYNAETAAVAISKEFSNLGVNMAALSYSGGRSRSEANGGDQYTYNDTYMIRDVFSSDPILDFGDYDTNYTTGGGTNMAAGLSVAKDLLKNVNGIKHIVLLSDGVPTFYYDESGYTKGPGNSNTDEKISQVPTVVEKTIAAANVVKNSGITIHTIGYHLDKLDYVYGNLKENELATQTLIGVSSSAETYHLVDSSDITTDVNIELGNIKNDIMYLPVAHNPIITDGIGNNFILSGANNYGGTRVLSKDNYAILEGNWQSMGSFDLEIDQDSPTNWYFTNNNFTLEYTHITKGLFSKEYTDNPEVYWSQLRDYTIYHVELENPNNVLDIETGSADFGDTVTVNKQNFDGFVYDSQDKNVIVIDDDNNVAYVYYTKPEGKVIVHYVVNVDGEYIPFNEYGRDEFGNVTDDFKNVNLDDDILGGKIGEEYKTTYRIVNEYTFDGLYYGNILENPNIVKAESDSIVGKFEEEVKEYTYVYIPPVGDIDDSDNSEDIILPPNTGLDNTFNYNYVVLFGLVLVIKKYIDLIKVK